MEISDCFKVGYVSKTHGLKGEVTVVMGPDCPDLTSLKSLLLEFRGQLVPHFLKHVSVKGVSAFVKFEDVSTAEQAQSLKGCSLYISKKDRPRLAKGEFYNDEVVGLEVEEVEKGVLGSVSSVFEGGAGRYLVVLHEGKEVMIPVNGPFIKAINKTKKKITVELPEGFLDI